MDYKSSGLGNTQRFRKGAATARSKMPLGRLDRAFGFRLTHRQDGLRELTAVCSGGLKNATRAAD